MRSGFRFDPPPVKVGAELRWLLWRAFGLAGETLSNAGDVDADAALALAGRFDLEARVGARTPRVMLESELGSKIAGRFHEEHAGAAVRSLLAGQVCRELAEAGRRLDVPLIFLKGAALQRLENVAPGSRNMSDVDVLAPEDGARRLQATLVKAGCKVYEGPESEHQLQLLTHRLGLGIEVHKIIPGVRLVGESSSTAEELIERGLVDPAQDLGDGCWVPSEGIMLAHLLVHGIAQHGMAPGAYPMARMLADVQDLEPGEENWETASRWIGRDVSRNEVEAVAGLMRQLGAGEDPAEVTAGGDEAGALLRHVVAGVLNDGYARSMKFRSLTAKPKDITQTLAFVKTVRGAMFPSRAQIDILYGPPRSELGYWGWRLWRPFDLIGRTCRYGAAWVGQRFRFRN